MNTENDTGQAGTLDSPVAGSALPQGSLLRAAVFAATAALIGAIVWAAVAIVSDYELGILAWAIGGLVGYAVAGKAMCRGISAQIISAGAAFCGIALGKYFAFSYFVEMYHVEELGEEATFLFGIFLPVQVSMFFHTLPEILSPYDLLWVGLALVTAISMTKRIN